MYNEKSYERIAAALKDRISKLSSEEIMYLKKGGPVKRLLEKGGKIRYILKKRIEANLLIIVEVK